MTMRFIVQLLESPLPARLLPVIGLFVFFLYLRSKDAEGHSSAFLFSLAFLAFRDIVLAIYPLPDLFFVSDTIYFCFILFIFLAPCVMGRPWLVPAIALNVLAALFFTVDAVYLRWNLVPLWAFRMLLVADSVLIEIGRAHV